MRAIILISLFFFATVIHSQKQEGVDFSALYQQTVKHLETLISIDTSSATGNDLDAGRYIYSVLNASNIDWDIFIVPKNDVDVDGGTKFHINILAKIPSSKMPEDKRPAILLLSHIDTVSQQEGWRSNPFKAERKNGKIYGLGSSDAKNFIAVNLSIFQWISQYKTDINRDIYFLVTSDEETGSNYGLKYLIKTHPEIFTDIKYALNEGGAIVDDENFLVMIEALNKNYMDIKITTRGQAGHSAIPYKEHAVYKLSNVLTKLESYNTKSKLNDITMEFFNRIFSLQDRDAQTTINLLLSDNEELFQSASNAMSEDPFFKSQLKNTFVPTILASGESLNAISATAVAHLNCRILPNYNPDDFFNEIQGLFEDDSIELKILERPYTDSYYPMPLDDELFTTIERTFMDINPNATVTPIMSVGSSDSLYLRELGIISYGLGVGLIEDDTLDNDNVYMDGASHSSNEYISEKDLRFQLEFTFKIIDNFTSFTDLDNTNESADNENKIL